MMCKINKKVSTKRLLVHKRILTKLNCLIHTDAIKDNLVAVTLTAEQKSFIYANEADMLNIVLFGMRAREWKDNNPDEKGNIRDYALTVELAILSNIEYQNAKLIEQKILLKEIFRREVKCSKIYLNYYL